MDGYSLYCRGDGGGPTSVPIDDSPTDTWKKDNQCHGDHNHHSPSKSCRVLSRRTGTKTPTSANTDSLSFVFVSVCYGLDSGMAAYLYFISRSIGLSLASTRTAEWLVAHDLLHRCLFSLSLSLCSMAVGSVSFLLECVCVFVCMCVLPQSLVVAGQTRRFRVFPLSRVVFVAAVCSLWYRLFGFFLLSCFAHFACLLLVLCAVHSLLVVPFGHRTRKTRRGGRHDRSGATLTNVVLEFEKNGLIGIKYANSASQHDWFATLVSCS